MITSSSVVSCLKGTQVDCWLIRAMDAAPSLGGGNTLRVTADARSQPVVDVGLIGLQYGPGNGSTL